MLCAAFAYMHFLTRAAHCVFSRAAAESSAQQRGQQLLDELAAELAALEEEIEAPEGMTKWYTEVEGVLAKMDSLQTGYQVSEPFGRKLVYCDAYPWGS